MEPVEEEDGGGDLEKVFKICDTDNDGLVTKADLELILQGIGVEHEDISELLGLQEDEFINFNQFVEAIDKFRSHSSAFMESVISDRDPRSQAGSVLGGDHSECGFTIQELSSRNSVLSKQVFALEAQILELRLVHEDHQKNEKRLESKARKNKLQFSAIAAELEAVKQANKDLVNRESDLKRSLRQLQDHVKEENLNSARELESARSIGSNPSSTPKAPRIHPDTQAELDRLKDELERKAEEAQILRRENESLASSSNDDKFQMKILDARIEKLNLELEAKDVLFAELGLVPDKQGGVTDIQGKTWHGFRNASPLYSELAHAQHPSLIGARNVPHAGIDNAFLKEKVANVNEEIRRRGVSERKRQHPVGGSIASNSDEPGGETDTSYSVSESEDNSSVRQEKLVDDLVTNQLMNLSDLLITTSDIAHSNRATPNHLRGDSTTPSTGGPTPVPASESSDTLTESDLQSDQSTQPHRPTRRGSRNHVVDASVALATSTAMASPLIRATTPTPTHGYGPSPEDGNLMHVHDSPPGTADTSSLPIPKLEDTPKVNTGKPPLPPTTPANKSATTPRNFVQPSPRSQQNTSSQSAPSTFRLDDELPSIQDTTTPLGKRMTLSKSEKLIRQKGDKKDSQADPSPYKPNSERKKPELQRHKSEVSLYNSDRNSVSPGVRNMEPDQVNELQEFALKAGLIRPRSALPKVDKTAQAEPSDFEPGARIEGKTMTATSNPEPISQRIRRSRSQPYIPSVSTPLRTSQRVPAQPTPSSGRTAQQSDRRIVVRGNPYLIRLLSYPDPAIDDMEEVVKRLETELDSIEERLNKPATSSAPATTSTSAPSSAPPITGPSSSILSSTPTTPSPPVTPSTFANSLPAPSFTRRTTNKPSPLVTPAQRNATPRMRTRYWWLAVGCLILAIVFGITKLYFSPQSIL